MNKLTTIQGDEIDKDILTYIKKQSYPRSIPEIAKKFGITHQSVYDRSKRIKKQLGEKEIKKKQVKS